MNTYQYKYLSGNKLRGVIKKHQITYIKNIT